MLSSTGESQFQIFCHIAKETVSDCTGMKQMSKAISIDCRELKIALNRSQPRSPAEFLTHSPLSDVTDINSLQQRPPGRL